MPLEAFLRWIEETQGAQARAELEATIRSFPTPEERGVFVRGLPSFRAWLAGATAPPPVSEAAITTPGEATVRRVQRSRETRIRAEDIGQTPTTLEGAAFTETGQPLTPAVPSAQVTTQTITLADGRVVTALINNETGQVVQVFPAEAPQAGGITPFQEAELTQRRLEFEQTQALDVESLGLQREGLRVQSREEDLRQQLAFQQRLEGLSGPRDFLRFFFATNPPGSSPRGRAQQQLRAIDRELAQVQEQIATDFPTGGISPEDPSGIGSVGLDETLDTLNRLNKMRQDVSKLTETASDVRQQAQPQIPANLAPFIRGGETGRAFDPATQRIITPSAQQVSRTDPDTFQALLGVADLFSGRGTGRTAERLKFDIEAALPGRRGQQPRLRTARQRG